MKPDSERAAGLAFIPIFCTWGFYALPLNWQSNVFSQLFPQITAYLALGLWAFYNVDRMSRLGLTFSCLGVGVKWGTVTGISLGCFNAFVILFMIPSFGGDITFLRNTPHAQIPFWIMVPWFILCIASAVELNFRGFLLGRLLHIFSRIEIHTAIVDSMPKHFWTLIPLVLSALTFSFDPFMVATFGALHWIAVWDGLIWGWMWIRMRNLYAVIIAHGVEVLILYLTVRAALL